MGRERRSPVAEWRVVITIHGPAVCLPHLFVGGASLLFFGSGVA